MTNKDTIDKLNRLEFFYWTKPPKTPELLKQDIENAERDFALIRKDLEILELIKERLHHDIFGNIQFVDKPTERIDENGNKILIDDGKYKIMEWLDNDK